MSWVGREGEDGGQKHCSRKRAAREIVNAAAFIYFDSFHTHLISTATGCRCEMIRLVPDRPCIIGRSRRSCDYVLEDRRVSKQHCQILFDGFLRKIFILDGGRFRTKRFVRFNLHDKHEETAVRASSSSLNGVFLNGFRIGKDAIKELSAGDEVSFVCRIERLAGFLIKRVVYTEEETLYPSRMCEGDDDLIIRRANFYLGHCRCILNSDDPISYIRESVTSYNEIQGLCSCSSRPNNFPSFPLSTDAKLSPVPGGTPSSSRSLQNVESSICIRANVQQLNSLFLNRPIEIASELNHSPASVPVPPAYVIASAKPKTMPSNSMDKENDPQSHVVPQNETCGTSFSPPGKKFYLNRLEFMNYSSSGNHTVISLPELLFPVENLSRIFVATFTSDVLW